LDKARNEFKPSLVELVTYRMDDHTTSDDASRYRKEDVLAPWRARDPIDRLRKYLTANKGWDENKEADFMAGITAKVERTVREYEGVTPPEPASMFDNVYAQMPWHLQEERDQLLGLLGEASR
jgi:TPP-dependent pyruvate/acetoin dehydrogenase alpha subunit